MRVFLLMLLLGRPAADRASAKRGLPSEDERARAMGVEILR
jgi:hypothetical protein